MASNDLTSLNCEEFYSFLRSKKIPEDVTAKFRGVFIIISEANLQLCRVIFLLLFY